MPTNGNTTFLLQSHLVVAAHHHALCAHSALAKRMAAAAGMRNILVHGYLDVDDDAVWNALAELDDMRQFAATVQQMLDAEPSAIDPGRRAD